MKKWFKYTIDYEYGMATLLTRDRQENLSLFYNLASNCFGIRKSIGETKLINEELVDFDGRLIAPKNTGEQVMKMGMGDYFATMLHAQLNRDTEIDIPKEKLDSVSFILAHDGDVIAFSNIKDSEGEYWKLKYEGTDDWCTCQKQGTPELTCKVHDYLAPSPKEA